MANALDRPLYVPAQTDAAYRTALITAMGPGTLERTPEALDDSISPDRFILSKEHGAVGFFPFWRSAA